MHFLFIHSSWSIVLIASVVTFGLGLLFKSALIMKQRKRILRLEDEMLANHAHILTLEKKITDSTHKNGMQQEFDLSKRKLDRGDLKVS